MMNNNNEENLSARHPGSKQVKLSSLIEASPDPVLSFDPDSIIRLWNSPAENLFGYTKEETIGRSVKLLIPADEYSKLEKLCERLLQGIPIAGCDVKGLKKNGEHLDLRFSLSSTPQSNNQILITAVIENLTKRNNFRKLLAKKEERYRTLVNLVSNMVWIADSSGSITEEVTGWEEFTGQTKDEYLDWGWTEAVHPDDLEQATSNWKRSIKEGNELYNEFRLQTRNNDYRRVMARGIPLRDSAGNVRYWVGLISDIEDQRAAEEARVKAERNFRTLITQVKDYAIFSLDPNGIIQTWNHGVYQVLGYKEDEFIGHDSSLLFTEKAVEKGVPGEELDMAAKKGTANNDRWMKHKDNREIWIAGRVSAIRDSEGKLIGFTKVMRDQTDWKIMSEERNLLLVQVQRHSQKLESLAKASLRFAEAPDLNNTLQVITEEAKQIIRSRRSFTCIIENNNRDSKSNVLVTPERDSDTLKFSKILEKTELYKYLSNSANPLRLSRSEMKAHHLFQSLQLQKSFSHWMQGLLATALRNKRGESIGYILLFDKTYGEFTEEDEYLLVQLAQQASKSTEQAQIERNLRESEKRFRIMADSAPVLIWMTGSDGRPFWFNKAWLDFTGHTLEQETGNEWTHNVHPDDYGHLKEVHASAIKEHAEFKTRYRLRRRDGEYRWILDNGVPRFRSDGEFRGFIGSCVDITEIEAAERSLKNYNESLEKAVNERTRELEQSHKRLQLSERMAAIGTLSAGLGHDMGNLLLPVRVRLERLNSLELPQQVEKDLKVIRTASDYLQKLSNGLRLLAMDPSRARHDDKTELRGWWQDVEGVLKNALPRGVELQVQLPEKECWTSLSRTSMTQIAFNLIQNSGDAMSQRGEGLVVLSFDEAEETDYIHMTVKDNGPGMTREVRRRCMEPFFSTKTRGVSTGFGLALVYGLVTDAGGEIYIDSEPGKGTAVNINIPKVSTSNKVEAVSGKSLALLDIKDQRMSSFIANELNSLDCGVTSEISENNPPDVFIVDTERISREPQLLTGGNLQPTIIYGNLSLDEEIPAHVKVLGSKPRLHRLRESLREAVQSLSEH